MDTASAPQKNRWGKDVRFVLNILGWLAAVSFLVLAWRRLVTREDWEQTLSGLEPGYVALALVLLLAGLVLRSQLGYASHRTLNYEMTRARAYRYWFLAQMGKYIPGGVWLVAARVVFYHDNGMPLLLASSVTVWEITSILMTGLLLSIGSLGLFDNQAWGLAIGGAALLMLIALAVSVTPLPWRILVRLHIKAADRILQTQHQLGNARFRLLGQLSALALVSWVIVGSGFYVLILSVESSSPVSWWVATVSYTVAWTAGFLIVFAPAGLGAREAVLALLLTPVIGETSALTVALLARLWATAAEGILIGTAIIWHFLLKGYRPAYE